MELVRTVDCFDEIVCYNPVKYKVTDRATQPDVIGFGIAAATEALHVLFLQFVNCRKLKSIPATFLFQKIELYSFAYSHIIFRVFSFPQGLGISMKSMLLVICSMQEKGTHAFLM